MDILKKLYFFFLIFFGWNNLQTQMSHGLDIQRNCTTEISTGGRLLSHLEGEPQVQCIVKESLPTDRNVVMKITSTNKKIDGDPVPYKAISYEILNGKELRKDLAPEEEIEECNPRNSSPAELVDIYCTHQEKEWLDFFGSVLARGPVIFTSSYSVETPEIDIILNNIPKKYVFKVIGECAKRHMENALLYARMATMADNYCLLEKTGYKKEDTLIRCLGVIGGAIYDIHKNTLLDDLQYIVDRTKGVLKAIEKIDEKEFLYKPLATQVSLEFHLLSRRISQFKDIHEKFLQLSNPNNYIQYDQVVNMSVGEKYGILNRTEYYEEIPDGMNELMKPTIKNQNIANPVIISSLDIQDKEISPSEVLRELDENKNDMAAGIRNNLDKINLVSMSLREMLKRDKTVLYIQKKYSKGFYRLVRKNLMDIRIGLENKAKEFHENFVKYNNLLSLLCEKARIKCPSPKAKVTE